MKIKVALLFLLAFNMVNAKENFGKERGAASGGSSSASPEQRMNDICADPIKSREFWINNVRMIVFTGGDMWWDRDGGGNPYYIIPATANKADGASSLFAGAIWLAGLDGGGQLKVAAMTYRQNGIDFWTGPLNKNDASVTAEVCQQWDRFFYITRREVDEFVASGGTKTTANILDWPGNADPTKGQDLKLAPFEDINGNSTYEPEFGEYPAYDVKNLSLKDNAGFCRTKLYGDETLFWVFNDKGGIHRESQGIPIGIEVRAQAFGFRTNDEINNMTFYSYEIFNRSSFLVNQTYFAVWNDADLGGYTDDYVGCDVQRGLGFMYNANSTDPTVGGSRGYGDFPPAVGCDFFRGPLADAFDGIDNDQDGFDEEIEAIGMAKFLYYNNNIGNFNVNTTNPNIASHYYGYMTGFWKDGNPFTQGGNAYGGSIPVNFVYDGDPVAGTGWTERTSGNLPGDRRFIQSAGPFSLKPGAVNYITFGMPWAQSSIRFGNLASITLLRIADDKAQALFNNCFKILDGPEAPDMTVQEMDKEVILYLTNSGASNNFNNSFADIDPTISANPTYTNTSCGTSTSTLNNPDRFYRFEGYKIYQLRDDRVNSEDLFNETKAKLVMQCDIKNDVVRVVNYTFDGQVNAIVPKVMVDGENKGLRSTVRLTEDAFASGDNKRLVNSKTYYYMSVAYAYNNYITYKQDQSPESNPCENYLGQKKSYLEGRKVKRIAAIPHITDIEKDGTTPVATYGYGPKVTRIEGQGNGGNFLDLTPASEAAIVANGFLSNVEYQNNASPLAVKVVDPLRVTGAEFTFRFIDPKTKQTPDKKAALRGIVGTISPDSVSWELKNITTGDIYYPNISSKEVKTNTNIPTPAVVLKTIKVADEYYIDELGLSISLKQVADPSEVLGRNTVFTSTVNTYVEEGVSQEAFLGASLTFDNPQQNWLTGLRDADGTSPNNWILSGGTSADLDNESDAFYYKKSDGKKVFYDPKKVFSNILNGTWAPYSLCSYSLNAGGRPFYGPGYHNIQRLLMNLPGEDNNTRVSEDFTDLRKLSSVDVVFTSDKSKWTRCPVLEMQERRSLSKDNSAFFQPRQTPSVDKAGIPLGEPGCNTSEASITATVGMGWFPGYAINLETGERLNMAFGEDSYQKENNGDDMMWNPTSTASANTPFPFAFGGKHFIYIFGNSSLEKFDVPVLGNLTSYYPSSVVNVPLGAGRYDNGARLMNLFNSFFRLLQNGELIQGAPANGIMSSLIRDVMWVNIPLTRQGFTFKNPKDIPTTAKVKIRVQKPYRYGYATYFRAPYSYSVSTNAQPQYANVGKLPLSTFSTTAWLPVDTSTTARNNNFPMYSFNTNEVAALIKQTSVAKNALDLIRVVPNPYYGASSYESSRIDNRVRITNLPNRCKIKIFTINGTLVRTFSRDVTDTEDSYQATTSSSSDIKRARRIPYEDWDLKNQSGVSVASGLYIIHIDAPGLGEKIVKWFGVMRPLDLQDY